MLSLGLTSAAAMAARRPAPPPPTRRMSCDRISMESRYPRASHILPRIAFRCKWNYRRLGAGIGRGRGLVKTDGRHCRYGFRILHECVPDKAGALVLGHQHQDT